MNTKISIYHFEVGTVFCSTDDDIVVLDLPKDGKLVRVGLEVGLVSLYPAGQTNPERRARKRGNKDMSYLLSS